MNKLIPLLMKTNFLLTVYFAIIFLDVYFKVIDIMNFVFHFAYLFPLFTFSNFYIFIFHFIYIYFALFSLNFIYFLATQSKHCLVT